MTCSSRLLRGTRQRINCANKPDFAPAASQTHGSQEPASRLDDKPASPIGAFCVFIRGRSTPIEPVGLNRSQLFLLARPGWLASRARCKAAGQSRAELPLHWPAPMRAPIHGGNDTVQVKASSFETVLKSLMFSGMFCKPKSDIASKPNLLAAAAAPSSGSRRSGYT